MFQNLHSEPNLIFSVGNLNFTFKKIKLRKLKYVAQYLNLYIYTNISSGVEFQRWLVLKSKVSGQESAYYSKKIVVFYE